MNVLVRSQSRRYRHRPREGGGSDSAESRLLLLWASGPKMKGTSSAHDSNRAKEKAAETTSPPRRITRELYQHHLRSRGGREEGCERKKEKKGEEREGSGRIGGRVAG